MPEPDHSVTDRTAWNRFRPDDPGGHHESYVQRANHPSRPLAFWMRYTVFRPKGWPGVRELLI